MSHNKMQIYSTPTTSTAYVVEIKGAIEDFEDYHGVFKLLPTLTDKDSLTVRLNTPGGCCSVGWAIIDAIQSVPCIVDVIVTYPTYSMGAMLAMCGDSLTILEDSYIMFHDYSGGGGGKGGDVAAYTNNFRDVFIKRFNKLCMPFLTRKESDKMFEGKDIYIHDTDETLPARLARHFK